MVLRVDSEGERPCPLFSAEAITVHGSPGNVVVVVQMLSGMWGEERKPILGSRSSTRCDTAPTSSNGPPAIASSMRVAAVPVA
jgi:hypothetical protein